MPQTTARDSKCNCVAAGATEENAESTTPQSPQNCIVWLRFDNLNGSAKPLRRSAKKLTSRFNEAPQTLAHCAPPACESSMQQGAIVAGALSCTSCTRWKGMIRKRDRTGTLCMHSDPRRATAALRRRGPNLRRSGRSSGGAQLPTANVARFLAAGACARSTQALRDQESNDRTPPCQHKQPNAQEYEARRTTKAHRFRCT